MVSHECCGGGEGRGGGGNDQRIVLSALFRPCMSLSSIKTLSLSMRYPQFGGDLSRAKLPMWSRRGPHPSPGCPQGILKTRSVDLSISNRLLVGGAHCSMHSQWELGENWRKVRVCSLAGDGLAVVVRYRPRKTEHPLPDMIGRRRFCRLEAYWLGWRLC